ncbi:MAG TPA: hypothetical protein VKE96_11750 [Vicinamibacterales bacterium]|nr:hypothetical protein [Vicinamibacterales bacterium]
MKRLCLAAGVLACAACGPRVDLAKAVAPASVVTGWANGGTVSGKNKIVPAVSFRLKNVSDRPLAAVQVNAVFRRVNDPGEWSSGYLPDVAREIQPGTETDSRIVVGEQGYTGTDDRDDMLRNSHFVDAKAELFVKSGSSNWTRIGEYPVARQLLRPESH